MAARIVKEFKGHSGCGVYLMTKHQKLFVRKTGSFQRNLEQLTILNNFPVPKIYSSTSDFIDMEYIHGLDIRTYLINFSSDLLSNFLLDLLNQFAQTSINKDYSSIYIKFLDGLDFFYCLNFTKEDLYNRLPKTLPQSLYHGDLTLENIIYSSRGFYIIDCASGIWDSYIFDIAKLRQDLECKWFLRNNPAMLENKLDNIQRNLLQTYPDASNNAMLILMLLRVVKYCQPNDLNWQFLIKEINRLWK